MAKLRDILDTVQICAIAMAAFMVAIPIMFIAMLLATAWLWMPVCIILVLVKLLFA
jgi:hypothetical protein